MRLRDRLFGRAARVANALLEVNRVRPRPRSVVTATKTSRIRYLRAALATIAQGTPAYQLSPKQAQQNLHLAQRSAALAVEDDLAEEERARR